MTINIYAAIGIFIAFGALCFGIGSSIGRSAERQNNETEKYNALEEPE